MLLKSALELCDDGTFQACLHVTPMVRRIGITGPLVGESNATGEAHLSIDDDNAPMGAPVHLVHAPGSRWMIVGKGAACLAEDGLVCIGEFRAGTDSIQEYTHAHPGASPLTKRIPKLSPYSIGIKQECLKVDARLRIMNRGEQRGKNLIAVVQQFYGISLERWRIRHRVSGPKKSRISGRKIVLGAVIDDGALQKNESKYRDRDKQAGEAQEYDPN